MVNESCCGADEGMLVNCKNAQAFSQNLEVFKMTKKTTKNGSVVSLSNDTIIRKASEQADKNDKYLSSCSTASRVQKKQSSVPPQSTTKITSPSHNNNSTNSIKNFFGKLIRTSLVNINESGFSSTLDKKKKPVGLKQQQQHSVDTDSLANRSLSSFKRGGVRATANARLQHNTYSLSNSCLAQVDRSSYSGGELDMLSFAKLSSVEVYDWLNRNGFEAYFPYNSEGYVTHR